MSKEREERTVIDTAAVTERRTLQFSCQNCILGDVRKLSQGDVRSTGNWKPGQIVQHIADQINRSIDGFEQRMPIVFRLVGSLIRKRVIRKPMKPGIRLPERFEAMLPPDDISFEQAAANIEQTIGRLKDKRMTAAHPLFGRLTHEQWMRLHCHHAEMHLSFIHMVES
ncbi:MAG: DUF1569 domain-containing protein [Phycisphaerales bacterium]|nr:DUF1569 domain-containing protein [Phycisphaerales bacterium]